MRRQLMIGADNVEAWLAALGLKVSKGGAGLAVLGWLSSSAAAAWFGALVAFCGLCVNAWFNWKRDRREQREHEARMGAESSNSAKVS